MKGRNAAKTFAATRGARFAASRKATEEKRRADEAAGRRRVLMVVDVDDVREDDEVAQVGGGFALAGSDRTNWNTSAGQTFVKRFQKA